MLILEGPDGGGKTTLANWLSETMEWPIAPKIVSSNHDVLTSKGEWVEENLERGAQPVIFDRHCLISEGIYGPIMRGTLPEEFQSMSWYKHQQARLRVAMPLVIWCLPKFDTVIQNVMDDTDIVEDHITAIYWAYFHAAASWTSPSLVWDYELSAGDDAVLKVHRSMLIEEVIKWRVTAGL